jgi:hypothetical protein
MAARSTLRNGRVRQIYPQTTDARRAECFRQGEADWDSDTASTYPAGEQKWCWQMGRIAGENAFWAARREIAATRDAA